MSWPARKDPNRAKQARKAIRLRPVQRGAVIDSDTVGCGAIPKHQFAQPEQLVGEWVRRDTLGYFLRPDDRLFELMACPEHLAGGDEIVVATDPQVQRLAPAGDSVRFLITYRRFGHIQSDTSGERSIFVAQAGIDSIHVSVIRTSFGWRFPFDVANPHLSPRAALEKVEATWQPASRDSLRALATNPPAR